MLKRLAFAVFFAIVLPISGQQQGPKSSANQTNGNGAAKPALPPSRMVTCEVKKEGARIECQWSESVPDGYLKRLFSPENTPNIALFFVGVGGIMVAICSLKIIERQTKATEEAAKAALSNAQAVINAERARLLFEVEKGMDQNRHGVAIFTIYAVNHGRTPAELVRIKGPVETVCGDIYDLPIPLKTHIAKLPDKWHVMPNEKCFVARFIPASMTVQALELAQTGGVSINEQERVIYGDMMYRDGISKDIRYSRYCFRFNREPFSNIGGSIEPTGPSEFNQKT
jgi:hypothetical protein